jgi:hypothetical protein
MSLFAKNPYAIGIQPVADFCHFWRSGGLKAGRCNRRRSDS